MNKTKKRKNIILSLFLGIILLAVLSVVSINVLFVSSTERNIVQPSELIAADYDCIIILGAGVRDNGTPSHMLEDRLKVGVDIYNSGACDTILMSGDHGREHYDEVNIMKNFAITSGVPSERIFMDHAGFSTYESIYRAKHIFGAEKIIIVTQKYHLYRALYIADSFGIEAVGVPADLRTYMGQSMREAREIAARYKDFFYTVVKPKPTYLGDRISLDDSGDVTND